ncbi:MAG: hypothetical protein CL846_04925 [Crocinitomicaceae bacterium]|nr:hypothetical protein [Crocinitomicaceae bacterium]|tara:strand:- start:2586 stop:3641 length:1056 start_codon:yes stop_codon:yes gene_type:complete
MFQTENCKYIFYASNLISFYNSLEIIKKYNIPGNNCIFYSPRKHINYKIIPSKSSVIEFKNIESLSILSFKSLINLIKNFYYNYKILKRELKGTNYIVFLPHLINYREQTIVFNRRCKGYCYVEEGLPAYMDIISPYNLVKRYFIERILNLLINREFIPRFIKTMNQDSDKFLFAFGNFKTSFSTSNKKIILKNSFPKNKKEINLLPRNSHLFVIDHIKGLPCSEKIYFECFAAILKKLKKAKNSNVYIKLHPNLKYSPETKHTFEQLCKAENLNAIILEENFFIEGYLKYQPNINLYGLKSASLVYGILFGAKVHCFSNYYKKNKIKDEKIYLIEKFVQTNKLSDNIIFI